MAKEQYSLFPFKEDIIRAEYIANSLLTSDLPREIVKFSLEGQIRQGLAFHDSIGSTIIVSDEYVVSISEEFYGFYYLTRIASFSNN